MPVAFSRSLRDFRVAQVALLVGIFADQGILADLARAAQPLAALDRRDDPA